MANFLLSMKLLWDGNQATAGIEQSRRQVAGFAKAAEGAGSASGVWAGALGRLASQNNQVVSSFAGTARASQQAGSAIDTGIRKGGKAVGLARHEVTNLSYQMNDIVMMLASGQSPFMLMMQQGSQVAQIMGKRGLGEIIPALGAGLASLVTPTTLFLAAITAGGYAASAIISSIRGEVVDLGDVIDEHEQNVRRIREAWGTALEGVETYARESEIALGYIAERTRDKLEHGIRDIAADLPGMLTRLLLQNQVPLQAIIDNGGFEQLRSLVAGVAAEARNGVPDIAAFRDRLAEIARTDQSQTVRQLADALFDATEEAGKADRALRGGAGAIAAIGGAASSWAGKIDDFADALKRLSDIAPKNLSDRELAAKALGDAIDAAAGDYELLTAAGVEYAMALERIANAEAGARVPLPKRRPSDIERLGWFDPPKRTRSRQNPADSILTAQTEELERLRLEAELLGKSAAERERAIAAMEAEQQIRRRGIDIHSQEAQKIRDNAAALAEERIAHQQAAEALQFNHDAIKGFLSTLRASLLAGKSLWESFGDAVSSVIDKIADKLENELADAILDVLTKGSGSSGSGGFFGSLIGLLGKIFKFADGGEIVGPGGPRDDRVPVLASNGEFIVNAAATARYRPLLHAINDNRLPRFASGGLVSTSPAGTAGQAVRAIPANMAGMAASITYAPVYNIEGKSGDPQEIVSAIEAYDKGRLARLARDLPELRRRGAG